MPDALVVDMLPAGLELENQNLANSSANLQDNGTAVQEWLNQMQQADIQHMEFRDDRFVAAVALNADRPLTLVYLARGRDAGVLTMYRRRRLNQCMFQAGAQRVRLTICSDCRSVRCGLVALNTRGWRWLAAAVVLLGTSIVLADRLWPLPLHE
ncbi:Uncharacterised protein [Kluyvera cryocrescens]|uniref:Bacterial alpha-2-macroglobulin MG10 domain-containing protein n=1 Tax=Kluyvera cryocrescens TaxID=580 RepID=A0A485ASL6_KLUCR|nr:Uncharacterised protein [Kluyvera cryocrescens]